MVDDEFGDFSIFIDWPVEFFSVFVFGYGVDWAVFGFNHSLFDGEPVSGSTPEVFG